MMSKRKREKGEAAGVRGSKKARTEDSIPAPQLAPIDGASKVPNDAKKPEMALQHVETETTDNNGNNTGFIESDSILQWRTQSVGGQILDLDPVFSEDEEYYILAYTLGIKVFSSKTSLLVQSHPVSYNSQIVGLALSPSNAAELIVGLADGHIQKWNWRDNVEVAQLEVGKSIQTLAVTCQFDGEIQKDLVYVAESGDGAWNIAAYCFEEDNKEKNGRILLSSDSAIKTLQVVSQGRFLTASSGRRVILGAKRGSKYFPTARLQYHWREFNCTDVVTTVKGYVSGRPKSAQEASALDVAVGTRSGFIYLYQDIINQLNAAKESQIPPPIVRLHWHRNAVAALDWSKDGQYLISGGEESVLVLWQLDRVQKSFLPHLSSPIQRVVVSPAGSSYGVTLSDNSSMVLKVLTLEPETSIAEPQLFSRNTTTRGLLPRLRPGYHAPSVLPSGRSPVAIAGSSSKLLFASKAPSYWGEDGKMSTPSPYLHVFDYKNGVQITKQALARTLVTDRKVDPHGLPLDEPSIALLRASSDGRWLATIDEWLPPGENFGGSSAVLAHWRNTRLHALESHLRFWAWRDSKKTWEIVETVNLSQSLHSHSLRKSKIVLDLVSDPIRARFYTLGEDSVVRVWTTVVRTRDGLRRKDDEGNDIVNWSCGAVGSLPTLLHQDEIHTLSGRVAISGDGSLLVAAMSTSRTAVVCAFDLRSRQRLSSQHNKISGPIRYIDIIGPCVVAVSDVFAVWNLIDSSDYYHTALDLPGIPRDQNRAHFHVACDAIREIIAVVCPTLEGSTVTFIMAKDFRTQTSINLPSRILSFLHTPAQRGFLAINADSEITLLTSSMQVLPSSSETAMPSRTVALSSVFGSISLQQPSTLVKLEPENKDEITPTASVATQRYGEGTDALRRILDASQPLASPTVLSMFHQVAAVMFRNIREPK